MYVLTASQMKSAEQFAHDERGLTSFTMMGIAGRKCADYIAKNIAQKKDKICILCGRGKNAGDGFVIAATLYRYGFINIFVILTEGKTLDATSFKMLGEMRKFPINIVNYADYQRTALNLISDADVLIDAIFGIGFVGELRGNSLDAIVQANLNRHAKKVAIDIPSGVRCDEGDDNGEEYFHCDVTLTMIAYKPCNVLKPNMYKCGRVEVIKLGLPSDDVRTFGLEYDCITHNEVEEKLPKRHFNAQKGDFGKALIVAGSYKMIGCTYLATQSAVEMGAGLVRLAVPDKIYPCVATKLNEPIFEPCVSTADGSFAEQNGEKIVELSRKSSCIAMGMGIGTSDETKKMVKYVIENSACPIILDADALNCIDEDVSVLSKAKSDILITPHPGEMSRLTNIETEIIVNNTIETSKDFAKKYNVNVLLKGPNTVIVSKDGKVGMNTTGNPSMSRGGSGDVLSGIICGIVCQGHTLFDSACIGAFIHGGTGDYVAEKYGELAATPSRVTENIQSFLRDEIYR